MSIFSVKFLLLLIAALVLYYTAARRKQWILLLVFNHPDEKYTLKVNAEKRCRVLLWIRILTIVPFAVLTLYLFTHVQERVYL